MTVNSAVDVPKLGLAIDPPLRGLSSMKSRRRSIAL
jgi:hypothetical protein